MGTVDADGKETVRQFNIAAAVAAGDLQVIDMARQQNSRSAHRQGQQATTVAALPKHQWPSAQLAAVLSQAIGGASWALATAVVTLIMAGPARADSNFGDFTLDAKSQIAVVNGSTGGSTSLPAVVANTDRKGNRCLGFADPKPDHVMQLPKPIGKLSFQVDSGSSTTLVIVGPDGTVRCSTSKKDAQLEDVKWQAGAYQIWVGSMAPGKKSNYRLVVQGQ
jgi:hypothetical protein